MSKQTNSLQNSLKEGVPDHVAPKKSYTSLYNDSLCAELLELLSDTEILFRQLHNLSRQSLNQTLNQALTQDLDQTQNQALSQAGSVQ